MSDLTQHMDANVDQDEQEPTRWETFLDILEAWWFFLEPIQFLWLWLTNGIIYLGTIYGVWHIVKYRLTNNPTPLFNLLMFGKHPVPVWPWAEASIERFWYAVIPGLLVFLICATAMRVIGGIKKNAHCLVAAIAWGGWILFFHTLSFTRVAWPAFQNVIQPAALQ